ncbi:hypothetical protein AMJ86_07795, partial [bacterium SM23_57]
LILPDDLRQERADVLEAWRDANKSELLYWEVNGLSKVIAYLREGKDPSWTDDLRLRMRNELDFYLFYRQYDERRGKSFHDTFSTELVEWYDDLSDQYEEDINIYHEFRSSGTKL